MEGHSSSLKRTTQAGQDPCEMPQCCQRHVRITKSSIMRLRSEVICCVVTSQLQRDRCTCSGEDRIELIG
jgi:hypothetical protein